MPTSSTLAESEKAARERLYRAVSAISTKAGWTFDPAVPPRMGAMASEVAAIQNLEAIATAFERIAEVLPAAPASKKASST